MLGIRSTGLAGDARGWGDPERRVRARVLALLVGIMTVAFVAGAWVVLGSVRSVMLNASLADVRSTLAMQLSEDAGGALVAPPLTDAARWSALLARYARSGGVRELRVLGPAGTVRWSLGRADYGTEPFPPAVWARAIAGQTQRWLRAGPRGPEFEALVPVTLTGSGPAEGRHGAVAVRLNGAPLAAGLRRVTIEVAILAALMIAAFTALMLHLARLVTLRSFRDRLTGLHNLRHFESSAAGVLSRLQRHGRGAAVLALDVRRLRSVNDALGHRAGDAVLRLAADVLRTEVRPADYLSRVGGQFLILLDEIDAAGAEAFAQRATTTLERTVELADSPVRLRAAAGIALFPHDGDNLDELLANADSALREAKTTDSAFVFFRAGLARSTAETLALESDLAAALAQDELVLYGQPLVELATGRVAGVETLARWQHPQRGLLPPGAFIPQAEESGLIRQLDRWVLDAAAAAVAGWAQAGYDGFVSVNLSGASVADTGLPSAARRALQRHRAPAGRIVLEVTETAAIGDLQGSQNVLEALKALGFRIALDDFGTGYSSLAYLRRLPVDLIKIDRQFVDNVVDQRSDQQLVRALLMYTRGLHLEVVAEGIETRAQHGWLGRVGVRLGQGFLYGAPAPLDRPPQALQVPELPASRLVGDERADGPPPPASD